MSSIKNGKNINTIGTRIKAIRNKYKLNQTQMAKKINVHLQTLSRYERNVLMPSVDIISSITEQFNVNPQWLLNAEGEMLKDCRSKENDSLFSIDDPRILTIIEWLRANPEDIGQFLKLINSMREINEAAQNLKKRRL